MDGSLTQITPAHQAYAQANRIEPRRFSYQPGENGQLLIAGRQNQLQADGGMPTNDAGNLALSVTGQLQDSQVITSLSNQVPVWGFQRDQQARFALPNGGMQHAFTSIGKDGSKTGVVTASLTDPNNPSQRASLVRLVSTNQNQQLTGFINKIYTNDGRVIEMQFKDHGQAPVRANIDLQADGKIDSQWVDLTTEEGRKTITQKLGANQSSDTPNDGITKELDDFCRYINLSPEAVLYRLGIGKKPAAEQSNPNQPATYDGTSAISNDPEPPEMTDEPEIEESSSQEESNAPATPDSNSLDN